MCYVIASKKDGIINFLQYRNVVNWFFYNNTVKLYKTLATAKTSAMRLARRYNHTWYVLEIGDYTSTDDIRDVVHGKTNDKCHIKFVITRKDC